VLRLVENPAPLIDELTRDGTTLLHGDFYDSNLGLDGDRVIAIDWTMACQGPAEVDFAYYLHNFGFTPAQRRDELIADWRSIRGDDFDERRLRLALLFEVVIKGWCWAQSVWATNPATRDRLLADMAWWLDQARAALELWSPSRG
ncbi:MAG: hypothetical protein QOD72_2092, partial [Acidimicrobiaceae bacterium]|nr:hypothetical protein [Acidimicrobiaceae bacterium]